MISNQLHNTHTNLVKAILSRVNSLGFTKEGRPMDFSQAAEVAAGIAGDKNRHVAARRMKDQAMARYESGVLQPDQESEENNDYVLNENAKGCWVRMGEFMVHLYFTDEGIVADIDVHGDVDSIASTYAFFEDAEARLMEINNIEEDDIVSWVRDSLGKAYDELTPQERLKSIRSFMNSQIIKAGRLLDPTTRMLLSEIPKPSGKEIGLSVIENEESGLFELIASFDGAHHQTSLGFETRDEFEKEKGALLSYLSARA